MSKRDLYEVLNVNKGSSDSEIKKAYRSLARKYHPDVNKDPDAENTFKEITNAYEVLSDSDKKARYDQFGHAGIDQQYGGGAGGFGGFNEDFGGFGDIFDAFFGGGRRRGGGNSRPNGPRRGADLRHDIEISFKEAIFGIEKEVDIKHLEKCSDCKGNGATPNTKIVSCPLCKGAGQIQQTQKTLFGQFTQVTTCHKCDGEGKWPEKPCKPCSGKGKINKTKKIKVRIPAGVDTGARLRVTGEGDAGIKGGEPGDLYVVLHSLPDEDEIFERRDNDVFTEINLQYHELTLGAEVEVPTLDGSSMLEIPAGTQVGTVFTMRGKGVPVLGTDGRRRGDIYIQINVAIPKKLSSEESKLIKQLAGLSSGKVNSNKKDDDSGNGSFMDVLKNAINRDR